MLVKDRKTDIQLLQNFLRSYPSYKVAILNLRRSLEHDITPKTTRYGHDKRSGIATKFSPTEEAFLDRVKVNEQIEGYQLLVDSIDAALSYLSLEQQRVIELRFFEGRSIASISAKLMFSERQIQRLKKGALERLVISLSPFLVDSAF